MKKSCSIPCALPGLTRGGFDAYFVDHGTGVYPASAAGMPYHAAGMQSKGDPITDLHENLAADAAIMHEQQAPKTGLKNGRNTNVGTSFLTHCSHVKEPPSAQAVRRLLCISQTKMAEEGQLAYKGLKQRVGGRPEVGQDLLGMSRNAS